MSMYEELALVADELLSEFGQSVTIRHTVPGEYDPEIGGSSLVTTESIGVGAVFPYGDKMIDGTMILSGDMQLLLSPVGIAAPVPGDRAVIDSIAWSIQRVKTTAPAGVAVIHECQLRR